MPLEWDGPPTSLRPRTKQDALEAAFESFGNEILLATRTNVRQTVDTASSMATALTSFAQRTNQTFPFVTLSDFETRGQQLIEISDAESLGYTPLVEAKYKDAWGFYVMGNQAWIYESMAVQGRQGEELAPVAPFIIDLSDGAPKEYYTPLWQQAPFVTTAPINIDLTSFV